MSKKEKVMELDRQEPKLTRSEIAKQAGCSGAYVTIVLGPTKKYKPRQQEIKEEPVAP